MGLASAYREPALRELMLVQELLRGRDVGAVLDVHRQQLIEEILDDLALHEVHLDFANESRDEEDVARLRGYLTTDGDIIIWSKFWETVSRLCIGASLEDIIDAPMQGAMGIEDGETRQRSDSDIARSADRKMPHQTKESEE